jgi:selenocysteine lyase/cysteine desulfurase
LVKQIRQHLNLTEERIFLSYCSVSPLYPGASAAACEFLERQARDGYLMFRQTGNILPPLHASIASLLNTEPANISFMTNTSEGLNMIANGYPLRSGDRIVSYVHEYPSNHYPWILQRQRGAEVSLLTDRNPFPFEIPGPGQFDLEELERICTPDTRILALSHVQFTSGFAADLKRIGAFCRGRGIDLVVDAAQSLGSLPVFPEEWNIAAVAASGWKWLLGPVGTGILYTSPEFRGKLNCTMAGADLMRQGQDYLNHGWHPHTDGRFFEYSTASLALAAGLNRCLDEIFINYNINNIYKSLIDLQNIFLDRLDQNRYRPLLFPERNRSGILSIAPVESPERLIPLAEERGLYLTARAGYLRIAPHFFNTEREMIRAAEILNDLAKS